MTTERTQEKRIPQGESTTFIPVNLVTTYSPSVCEVRQGTGFLGKFRCDDSLVHGLFTNNHILMESLLADDNGHVDLKFQSGDKKFRLHWKGTFRFTCPVLDITFIHTDSLVITQLREAYGCREFLTVCDSWIEQEGEQFTIIQWPNSCSGLQVASGEFYRMHGFDILHRASTDHGSSGSPLMTRDGKVIGIHKGRAAKESDLYNIAVSAKAVIAAIYHFKTLPQGLVANPRNFDNQCEDWITQQNLERTDHYFYGAIYKSPATDQDYSTSGRHGPIWFVPTSHGWYWTPTDPFDKELDANWMSVDNSNVIGENRVRLSEKSITIIKQLARWQQ